MADFDNPFLRNRLDDPTADYAHSGVGATPILPLDEVNNSFTDNAQQNVYIDRTQKARNDKIVKLQGKMGIPEGFGEDNSYADIGGYSDSLHNKVLNNYSASELLAIMDKWNDEYGLVQTPQGWAKKTPTGSLELVDANTLANNYSSLYQYGSQDGKEFKLGTWGGVNPNDRYSEETLRRYSEQSGRPVGIGYNGVNTEDLQRHYVLPKYHTNLLEALVHGNEEFLNNRSIRRPTDATQEQIDYYRYLRDNKYGSGASEYYNSDFISNRDVVEAQRLNSIWGEIKNTYGLDTGGFEKNSPDYLFSEEYRSLPFKERQQIAKDIAEDRRLRETAEAGWSDPLARLNQVPKVIAATLFNTVVTDSVVGLSKLTGIGNMDYASSTRKVEDLLGINPYYQELFQKEMQESVGNIYNAVKEGKPIELSDVGNLLVTSFSNIDATAASIAAIAVMFSPSPFGKASVVAKGDKIASGVNKVKELAKKGDISKADAINRIKEIRSTGNMLEKSLYVAHKNAGMGLTIAGGYGRKVESFQDNGGELDLISGTNLLAAATAHAYLDRWIDGSILLKGSPLRTAVGDAAGALGIAAKKDAVSVINTMGKEGLEATAAAAAEKKAILKIAMDAAGWTGKQAAYVSSSAGLLSAVAYTQTYLDAAVTRYNTEKYGNDLSKIINDKELALESWVAAGSAIGTAVHMDVGGRLTRAGMEKVFNGNPRGLANYLSNKLKEKENKESQAIVPADLMSQNADDLTHAVSILRNITEQGLNESNLGDYFEVSAVIDGLLDVSGNSDSVLAAINQYESIKSNSASAINSLLEDSQGELALGWSGISSTIGDPFVLGETAINQFQEGEGAEINRILGIVRDRVDNLTEENAPKALKQIEGLLPILAGSPERQAVTTRQRTALESAKTRVESFIKDNFNTYPDAATAATINTLEGEESVVGEYNKTSEELKSKLGQPLTNEELEAAKALASEAMQDLQALEQSQGADFVQEQKSNLEEVIKTLDTLEPKILGTQAAKKKSTESSSGDNTQSSSFYIEALDDSHVDANRAIEGFNTDLAATADAIRSSEITEENKKGYYQELKSLESQLKDIQAYKKKNNLDDHKLTKQEEAIAQLRRKLGSTKTKEIKTNADARNAALAEIAIHQLLAEGKKPNPTVLNTFARRHGITEDTINKILKSYESVEIESTVAARGSIARQKVLELELASGNPRREVLQKNYDEAVKFLTTTEMSISQLEHGIADAKARAENLNARTVVNKKEETFTTEYITHEESSSKGKPFQIKLKRIRDPKKDADGNIIPGQKLWVADVEEANKRINAKRKTSSNLKQHLDYYHRHASQYISNSPSAAGIFLPKHKDKGTEANREQDRRTWAKAAKTVQSFFGDDRIINKIIVGNNTSSKWSTYKALNSVSVNKLLNISEGYTADDVVLLHTEELKETKDKKGTYTELSMKDSPVSTEVEAARAAGSTIVADLSGSKNTVELLGQIKKKLASGEYPYVPLSNSPKDGGHLRFIFVPKTEANEAKIQEIAAEKKEARAKDKLKKEAQNKLVELELELRAAKDDTSGYTERTVAEIEADIVEARKEAEKYFSRKEIREQLSEAAEQVEVDESGFTVKPAEDTSSLQSVEQMSTPEERMAAFARREADVRLRTLIKEEREGATLVIKTPYIKAALNAYKDRTEREDAAATEILSSWSEANLQGIKGKKLEEFLNSELESKGLGDRYYFADKDDPTKAATAVRIPLGGNSKNLIESAAGKGREAKVYVVRYKKKRVLADPKTFELDTKVVFNKDNKYLGKEKFTEKGWDIIPISAREYGVDPTKYVKTNDATPLGTISKELLPAAIRQVSENTLKGLKELLPPLDKNELPDNFGGGKSREEMNAVFMAADSSARGLIFDTEGNINESFATALGVSIRTLLKNHRRELSLSYKSKEEVARMFSVQEHEVTKEMFNIAKENGVFYKTMANTLGKDVLGALGISKQKNDEVARGQYNALVSEIGGIGLLLAKEQGLLEIKSVKSNELAKHFKDSESRGGEATTDFVHITGTTNKKSKRFSISKKAETAIKESEVISDMFEDPTNRRTGPIFFRNGPPADFIEKAKARIKNDEVGAEVPEAAQEVLMHMMETPWEIDMEGMERLISHLNDPAKLQQLKETLGYIDVDSKKFDNLLFQDKDIQEALNDSIEKSLDELKALYELVKSGKVKNEFFFEYFYSTNQRFNINSNTVNPMADKFHRFYIRPKAHNQTYKISGDGKFTYDFTRVDENGQTYTGTKDMSYMVRYAIAQGIGIGTDKTSVAEVTAIGSYLLGLSATQLEAIEQQMIAGKPVVMDITVNGVLKEGGIEIKPDHLAHGLQVIGFLKKLEKEVSAGNTEISAALSAEFDAITSGFANKMQQFGINTSGDPLAYNEETIRQFGRVGIVLPNNERYADVVSGASISDILSEPTNVDSYKYLAKQMLVGIVERVKGLGTNEAKLMRLFEEVLPGLDQLGAETENIIISSALRNLAKPGFMTFNYAASIKSIKEALANKLTVDLLKDIATTDFDARGEDGKPLAKLAPLKAVATELASKVKRGENDTKTTPVTLSEFQAMLRSDRLDSIKFNGVVKNEKNQEVKGLTLESYIEDFIIMPTYGESVEHTFKTEFSNLIEIQDLTNEAFKHVFSVFDHMLRERIKSITKTGNILLTEAVVQEAINSLKPVFPSIAGPLSDRIETGIPIYSTDTRTPNDVMSGAPASKTHLKEKSDREKTKKTNYILRQIVEAVSSGAVIPYHALDGAQMTTLFQDMFKSFSEELTVGGKGVGTVAIHDAWIAALSTAEETNYAYNKNTVILNSEYFMMDEIVKMMERVSKVFTEEGLIVDGYETVFKLDFKDMAPKRGTKMLGLPKHTTAFETLKHLRGSLSKLEEIVNKTEEEKEKIKTLKQEIKEQEELVGFKESFGMVKSQLEGWRDTIKQARQSIYQEGTYANASPGTPGSAFVVRYDSNGELIHGTNNYDYMDSPAVVDNLSVPDRVTLKFTDPGTGKARTKEQAAKDNIFMQKTASTEGASNPSSTGEVINPFATAVAARPMEESDGKAVNEELSLRDGFFTAVETSEGIKDSIMSIFSEDVSWRDVGRHTEIVSVEEAKKLLPNLPSDAQAFHLNGKVHMIEGRLPLGHAKAVWLHEVFHKNAPSILGTKGMRDLQDSVLSWRRAEEDSIERQIYETAMRRAAKDGNITGELIPYAIEEAVRLGISPSDKTTAGTWLGRALQFFSGYLSRLIGKKGKLSVSELVSTAHSLAGREVINGRDKAQADAELMEKQFTATSEALGGREAHQKALDSGKTELNYRQWVQVRTPAFKEWFGNWETDPKGSSKTINPKTGEPQVFYHGTSSDFSVFRSSGQTNGLLFVTTEPAVASDYATGESVGYTGMGLAEQRIMVREYLHKDYAEHFNEDGLFKKGISKEVFKDILEDQIDISGFREALEDLDKGVALSKVIESVNKEIEEIIAVRGSVMPLFVKANNPKGSREDLVRWLDAEKAGGSTALINEGHDAIFVTEGNGFALAVVGANQLKSAIGNVGTFDVNTNEINYSLADTAEYKNRTEELGLGEASKVLKGTSSHVTLVDDSIMLEALNEFSKRCK